MRSMRPSRTTTAALVGVGLRAHLQAEAVGRVEAVEVDLLVLVAVRRVARPEARRVERLPHDQRALGARRCGPGGAVVPSPRSSSATSSGWDQRGSDRRGSVAATRPSPADRRRARTGVPDRRSPTTRRARTRRRGPRRATAVVAHAHPPAPALDEHPGDAVVAARRDRAVRCAATPSRAVRLRARAARSTRPSDRGQGAAAAHRRCIGE